MEILNNFVSIYCFLTVVVVIGAVFMLPIVIIAAIYKAVKKPRNKVRFFVTQEYGVHCLKLWMGKPELNEKMKWVSRSDTVHFLCDDFYIGNRNLFENYNLNPKDFADMKEGKIREVFINMED